MALPPWNPRPSVSAVRRSRPGVRWKSEGGLVCVFAQRPCDHGIDCHGIRFSVEIGRRGDTRFFLRLSHGSEEGDGHGSDSREPPGRSWRLVGERAGSPSRYTCTCCGTPSVTPLQTRGTRTKIIDCGTGQCQRTALRCQSRAMVLEATLTWINAAIAICCSDRHLIDPRRISQYSAANRWSVSLRATRRSRR